MTTISAKGLKKKQGCKGKRRFRSCVEVATKKKKIINNQYLQVIVSHLYVFFFKFIHVIYLI